MVPCGCGTTTVVVPELGGTTTVVALSRGGLLLTQPASIAPRINKLDRTFIFVSSIIRQWPFHGQIVDLSRSCPMWAFHACATGLSRMCMSPDVLHPSTHRYRFAGITRDSKVPESLRRARKKIISAFNAGRPFGRVHDSTRTQLKTASDLTAGNIGADNDRFSSISRAG
jgi:hypothetical protein